MIKQFTLVKVDTRHPELVLPEHKHLLDEVDGIRERFLVLNTSPKEFYKASEFFMMDDPIESVLVNYSG